MKRLGMKQYRLLKDKKGKQPKELTIYIRYYFKYFYIY